MFVILTRHIPNGENVRIVEIYQRYKLSDTKYALADVTPCFKLTVTCKDQ